MESAGECSTSLYRHQSQSDISNLSKKRRWRNSDFADIEVKQHFISCSDTDDIHKGMIVDLAADATETCQMCRRSCQSRNRARYRKRPLNHDPRSTSLVQLLVIAMLAFFSTPVLASQGDRSPEYQSCVEACKKDSCYVAPDWDDGTARYTRLPIMLRLTAWNCIDDCKYHCTHRVTNEAFDRVARIQQESWKLVQTEGSKRGWSNTEQRTKVEGLVNSQLANLRPVQKQMVQFHGKWVFVRFLGAQEPMSVLFSILNLQVHFNALSLLRKQVSDSYPLKLVYILHTLLCCNAWFWSAIFHTRDKNFTERMDYFAAGSVVLGGWFIAISRLFRLNPEGRSFNILSKACGAAFLLHVIYLSFGRFNYGYNMKVNIFFGMSQSILWLIYSVKPKWFSRLSGREERYKMPRLRTSPASPTIVQGGLLHSNGGSPPVPISTPPSMPPSSSRRSKRQLQKIIILLILATCLEVFDFPPFWRSLDAHSLWHAATVPLASMWYRWIIEDARECTSTGYWFGEGLKIKKSKTVEKASQVASNVVGPQVQIALQKVYRMSKIVRQWIESAAGKSSIALRDATGASTGIEFKTLTNKLNEIAMETFGKKDYDQDSVATAAAAATSTLANSTSSIDSNSNGHSRHLRKSSISSLHNNI